MSSSKPLTYAVAGIAAVAVAIGAYAVGKSNSGNGTSGTANAAQAPFRAGQGPRNGQRPPDFGTPATGAAAGKAKAAALAKYKGSVEQVMKLAGGSYVVHLTTSSGEYHVLVSKDFKVTGADRGGPGAGGPGVGGPVGAPPQGAPPPAGTAN